MLAGSPAGASVAAHSGVVTAATATGPAIVTALISNTTGWTNPIDTTVTITIV
jgi:mannosyltransferase OCH1-like enzyme